MGHQDVVVDSIKERFQFKFHTRLHMAACGFDRLVSASARTKTVAVAREQRIEELRELLQQCPLDQAIHDAGNAQLPGSAFEFGDFDVVYTLRGDSPASNRFLRIGQYCFT